MAGVRRGCEGSGKVAAERVFGMAQPAMQIQRQPVPRKTGRGQQRQDALVRRDAADKGNSVGARAEGAFGMRHAADLIRQNRDPVCRKAPVDKAFRQEA